MSTPLSRAAVLTRTNHGTVRGWVRTQLTAARWIVGGLRSFDPPDLARVDRLVFACLGNINRSCFAEAVARREGVPAASLGLSTTTGAPAYSLAMSTARGFGLDLRAHRATDIIDFEWRNGDLVLAMEARHAFQLSRSQPVHGAVALLGGWSFPRRLHIHDPYTLSPDYFVTCFTLIESATRHLCREWREAHPEVGAR